MGTPEIPSKEILALTGRDPTKSRYGRGNAPIT